MFLTLTRSSVYHALARADTCPDHSGCGTNYIHAKGGHVPQLGSCPFIRSIYYNQHTRIFRILSAEHLATPRSSQVLPNYFRHMLYSVAGVTPSAPSNPGHGRIDTLRKRTGRSFHHNLIRRMFLVQNLIREFLPTPTPTPTPTPS